MAKKDEYMEEAYSTLLELSADDIKRLEYEAREKALRDYNSQMSSSFQMGEKQGIEISRKVFACMRRASCRKRLPGYAAWGKRK